MTNYERWRILTSSLTSPESWIDFAFYFTISAALQRRVWFYGAGEDGSELYPNMYICLVGPPGLGKGIVLTPITRLLSALKYEKGTPIKTSAGYEKPLLFPVSPDGITFEELLEDIANNTRRLPKPDGSIYVHSSYAFILEELDSIFKKKTHDIAGFLKNAYDCKKYDYKTKHSGKNLLRFLCVSFIAATQPDFLYDARKAGLFGQGFASRALFLFEEEERAHKFHNTLLGDEQKKAETELIAWLKKLAGLYGEVRYDKETYSFLESWYRESLVPARIKAPLRLREYLRRKKVTMLKLAMAIHFSRSLEMEIPCDVFIEAIKLLDSVEPMMVKGLGLAGRNELHSYSRRIYEFILSRGVCGEREVIAEFSIDMSVQEIRQCLEQIELTGNIKVRLEKGLRIFYI